jgi:hypothetical protein
LDEPSAITAPTKITGVMTAAQRVFSQVNPALAGPALGSMYGHMHGEDLTVILDGSGRTVIDTLNQIVKGTRQRDVADRIGADTAAVTNWELGHTQPAFGWIQRSSGSWATTPGQVRGGSARPSSGTGQDSVSRRRLWHGRSGWTRPRWPGGSVATECRQADAATA